MIKCLYAPAQKAPLEYLKEILSEKDAGNTRVCAVVPTERNLRILANMGLKWTESYSVASFGKMISNAKAMLVPKELRIFYLKQAAKQLNSKYKLSVFKTEDSEFFENFITFAQNTSSIFAFFRELKSEMIDMDALAKAGKYTDYENQIEALRNLWNIYSELLEKDGFTEEWETYAEPEISEIFTDMYNEFVFLISGFLTKYELERLKLLGGKKNVTLIFNYSGKKYKQHKLYENFFDCRSLEDKEEPRFNRNTAAIYSTPSETAQLELITKKAFDIREKHGINFNKMAVIIPEERLKSYFLKLDPYNIFDVSSGEDINGCQFYLITEELLKLYDEIAANKILRIENIAGIYAYPALKNYDDIAAISDKLRKTGSQGKIYLSAEEIYDMPFFSGAAKEFLNTPAFITPSECAGVYKKLFRKFLDVMPPDETDDIHNGIILMEKLETIYKKITEKLPFSHVSFPIIQELSSLSRETSMKKIAVTGILETRNMAYDIVFLPYMNENFFPPKDKKDLFINTEIRRSLELPTFIDRENLLKNYLMQVLSHSKYAVISYIENTSYRRRSSFAEEIAMKNNLETELYAPKKIELLFKNKRVYDKYNGITVQKPNNISELLKGITVSASSFNDYIRCSLKFYLKYILKIKARQEISDEVESRDIGSAFHNAFKKLYEQKIYADNSDFERLFKDEYMNMLMALDSYKYNKAQQLMADINIKNIPLIAAEERKRLQEGYKITAREKTITAEFNGLKFYGIIDKVEEYNGALYITDYKYKNNDKLKTLTKANLDKTDDTQLAFYALLTEISEGSIARGVYYFNLKEKFEYKDAIDMNDYADFKMFFLEKTNEMKDKTVPFTQTEKQSGCGYCEYADICGRKNEFFSK